MLSIDALNSALPLTEAMDAKGLKIVPIPGTPLEKLVQATRSDDNFNMICDDGSVMPSLSDIEYIANAKDEVFGGSPHDMAFDNIVDPAVVAVQEHLNFARNVVKPAVQELVEGTAAYLEGKTVSALLGMEVVTYTPPAPVLNNGLDNLVRQFGEVSFDVPMLDMRCPTLPVSEIVELMKTGSASLDRDIENWVATLGESCIINVWENVFQQKQAELNDRTVVSFRDFTEDKTCGVDNALIIFLLARNLVDNVLPDTEMEHRAYENLMADFRNQAGARLCRAIDELEKISKTQTIVRSVAGSVTTVYSFTYDKWLKEGGSNEILFGNMLTTPSVVTADNLNARAEELKAKWTRHSSLTATMESNRRFLRTKEALVNAFEKQIREAGEGFIEEATLGNRETVIQRFRDMVEGIRAEEVTDLYGLALRLVCRARFAKTDAELILGGIERVKRENPDLDIREAAAISTREYVGYWVASQMKVEQAA